MLINKTDAEKHREVQDQKIYRETCRICGREFYTSLISRCPERGRNICMYCCRMCGHSYASPLGGWACRVKDAERAAGRGKTSSAPFGGTFPGGEGKTSSVSSADTFPGGEGKAALPNAGGNSPMGKEETA